MLDLKMLLLFLIIIQAPGSFQQGATTSPYYYGLQDCRINAYQRMANSIICKTTTRTNSQCANCVPPLKITILGIIPRAYYCGRAPCRGFHCHECTVANAKTEMVMHCLRGLGIKEDGLFAFFRYFLETRVEKELREQGVEECNRKYVG